MALPEISTGYKPEFGLGALYQGFNAGNASTGAELELIKQFLANQRSQEMNPLDAERKRQEISMDQYKTAPEYQDAMTNTQVGQSRSSLAAGDLAQSLLPFKQAKEQAELQSAEKEGNLFNKFFQARQDQFTTGKSEQEQMAAAQLAQALGDSLSRTPKQMGQERIADNKGEVALLIQEMRMKQALDAMSLKLSSSESTQKRAEQLMDLYRIIADPTTPEAAKKQAQEIVKLHTTEQMGKNPNAYKPQTDKAQFGLQTTPAPINQVGGGGRQGGGLEAAIMAEIERRKQQK